MRLSRRSSPSRPEPGLFDFFTFRSRSRSRFWSFFRDEEDGIRIIFEGEVEIPETGSDAEKVQAMTQVCADRFGRLINEHTEDWHMLQRIWIDGDFVERQS